MIRFNRTLAWLGAAALLIASAASSIAQERPDRGDRGNFDPEQFRQRMLDNYREQMGVKNDDEWKVISERIEGVMEARRAAGPQFGFGGPGFRGGPRGGGRPDDVGGDRGPGRGPGGPEGGDRGRFRRGEPSPEIDALRQAIDSNAPNEEIKEKMAKVRQARKQNEAKLLKAQEELRAVLNVRQEAVAVVSGLLQ